MTSIKETIIELNCNVDDMSGEAVGYALEELLAEGALEAFATPVIMKKSRPGLVITVLVRPEKREKMVEAIFRHTTTIGIRETEHPRYALDRKIETIDTAYGPVRRKVSSGYGTERVKYEYEDLTRIAREQGLSLREVEENL